MLGAENAERIWLAVGSTDMRKSIDSLCALIQMQFGMDPFAPGMYVFCNKARNKLKILRWDHNGFWLYYRRLERGVFQWPSSDKQVSEVSYREFRWLLDGLSPVQHKAHAAVLARVVL